MQIKQLPNINNKTRATQNYHLKIVYNAADELEFCQSQVNGQEPHNKL